MSELSDNLRAKLEKAQNQQKRTISDLEESRANEIEALQRRLEKSGRDREETNKKLAEYIEMYDNLEKHFKNPAEGSIYQERAQSHLYETLSKVT